MREFKSLTTFANFLQRTIANYPREEKKALNFIGVHLVEKAKESIGHLQKGAGPFQTWPELSPFTVEDKLKKGFIFNDEANPLLRTGEMRDSITHSVSPQRLTVGSNSEILIYQELGTTMHGQEHIPPRSVLGMTFFKEKFHIQEALADFLLHWISGKPQQRVRP
jgi:hypothetical protein